MATAKRGRPKGSTRFTIKKVERALEAVTSIIESEDFDRKLNSKQRRRAEGPAQSLQALLADLKSN